jgi:O-succinylbenzoic acid--CoA ligase
MQLRVNNEIELRGPSLMRGYLGAPPQAGWFATGDLGELDARGRLIVHARRTDLIVSGGENVYPAEVEAALLAHPLVREAAVLPAPDDRWGQVGVAYVSTTAAESELRAFLRERIAKFKVPARFVVVDELPRNAAGKVDRARLQTAG